MADTGIKATAESVLRELPGVVGAFVHPDAFGHPREIHLLIKPGPPPRDFAMHVKSVLESRLHIPIDQRIISIAQLAPDRASEAPPGANGPTNNVAAHSEAASLRFQLKEVESQVGGAHVKVRVQLAHEDLELTGEAADIESGDGRARAAAMATLQTLNRVTGERARFGLDFAVQVLAVGRPYILTTVTVTSPRLGRRSLQLAGAHPVEEDTETAAALAVLKATNRLIGFLMGGGSRKSRGLRGNSD